MTPEQLELGEPDDNKVCVVGATTAWPFYRQTGVYICQENRSIQEDTGRLGFYTSRLIQGVAPRIEAIFPSIDLDEATAAVFSMHPHPSLRRIGTALAATLVEGYPDWAVQVILLSRPDSPDTATFNPVRHEGRGAWTQRQRYAYLEQLRSAVTTADLIGVE